MSTTITECTHDTIAHLSTHAAKSSVNLKATQHTTWYAALVNGKVVGCGAVMWLKNGSARLKAAFVLEQYRERGIGTAVVDHRINVVLARGVRIIEVISGPERGYTRRGFDKVGTNAYGYAIMRKVFRE